MCLSNDGGLTFRPTFAVMDVQPIVILFVGPATANQFGARANNSTPASAASAVIAAVPSSGASILGLPNSLRVTRGQASTWLVAGYGLSPASTQFFLSNSSCSFGTSGGVIAALATSAVGDPRLGLWDSSSATGNVSTNLLPWPRRVGSHERTAATSVSVYISAASSEAIFSSPSAAQPLLDGVAAAFLCYRVPSGEVRPTAIPVVGINRRVTYIGYSVRLQSTAAVPLTQQVNQSDVYFASTIALSVAGFGLANSWAVVAPDCSDSSSFFFNPLPLLPRLIDSQSGAGEWFVSLTEDETSLPVPAGVVAAYWCVSNPPAGVKPDEWQVEFRHRDVRNEPYLRDDRHSPRRTVH